MQEEQHTVGQLWPSPDSSDISWWQDCLALLLLAHARETEASRVHPTGQHQSTEKIGE